MRTLWQLQNMPNLMIKGVGVDGGHGEIYKLGKRFATVIWSNGGGWDHVSIAPFKRNYTPSWEDMCKLKDMFFGESETVVQYHQAKKAYVNNVSNCLHLWRPIDDKLPIPPTEFV